jgi:hypothetical protein
MGGFAWVRRGELKRRLTAENAEDAEKKRGEKEKEKKKEEEGGDWGIGGFGRSGMSRLSSLVGRGEGELPLEKEARCSTCSTCSSFFIFWVRSALFQWSVAKREGRWKWGSLDWRFWIEGGAADGKG